MFDWLNFLQSRSIPYTSEGDTSRGKAPGKNNVMIHCPLCGGSTGIDYMHISLEGKGWYCWRRPEHAGRNPARLVAALLRVSISEAISITGEQKSLPTDFLGTVMSKLEPQEITNPDRHLKFPEEFRHIGHKQASILFYQYLRDRGFNNYSITNLADDYGVYFCRRGAYANRVIFPVIFEKKLITWTGRTISKNNPLRYKTLSTDPEKARAEGYAPAIGPITNYLLWYDKLLKLKSHRCMTLVVTEGPFDALKVMTLGFQYGVVATCLFTNRVSKAQTELLCELLPRFKYRLVMLDQGAFDSMRRICSDLSALNLRHMVLPANIKDPGELTRETLAACILQKR